MATKARNSFCLMVTRLRSAMAAKNCKLLTKFYESLDKGIGVYVIGEAKNHRDELKWIIVVHRWRLKFGSSADQLHRKTRVQKIRTGAAERYWIFKTNVVWFKKFLKLYLSVLERTSDTSILAIKILVDIGICLIIDLFEKFNIFWINQWLRFLLPLDRWVNWSNLLLPTHCAWMLCFPAIRMLIWSYLRLIEDWNK